MGKIIFNKDQTEEVSDGSELKEVCEEKFNIPFGCKDGICGTCRIEVLKGNENLTEKNEKEDDMFPNEPNVRLACQCNLKKGTVEITDSYS